MRKFNAILSTMALLALGPQLKVHAENTATSTNVDKQASATSPSADDFHYEFECGKGLKTTFANGAGTIGGSTHIVTPNLILVPAERNGAPGYYSLSSNGGAEFHPANSRYAAHSLAGIDTYYITMKDPVTNEVKTVSYDSFISEGKRYDGMMEADYEFLKLIGEKPADLPGKKVNDATAESDLIKKFTQEIQDASGNIHAATQDRTMSYLDYPHREHHSYIATSSDIVGSLKGIVCGCKNLPALKQPIENLLNSPDARSYKSQVNCLN
jgi:hypothetical protein